MGLILAITAALGFTALDVFRKLLGKRYSSINIVIGMSAGAAPVFAVLAAIEGFPAQWPFPILASMEILAFSFASILYVQAVKLSPLSLTIPYLGLTPVFSMIISLFLISETPDRLGLTGILLVVIGAVTIQWDKNRSFFDLLKAPFIEPGSFRMILVALLFGLGTAVDKISISYSSEIMVALALTGGSAGALLLYQLAWNRKDLVSMQEEKWYRDPLLYGSALVCGIAMASQFFAYQELLVSYVEAIKRTGGLVSALIGILFFREGHAWSRLPSAMLILGGAVLIML